MASEDNRPLQVVGYQAFLRRLGHNSGDGVTIMHCPFCGSGQVIASSDGTTECEYCGTCFNVTVQPMFPAYPQTIDGMPVQVPGMPPRTPMDPNADPAADGGQFPPGADQGEDPGAEEGEEDDGQDGGNPFAKSSAKVFRNIG